jgi:hypothetical protein
MLESSSRSSLHSNGGIASWFSILELSEGCPLLPLPLVLTSLVWAFRPLVTTQGQKEVSVVRSDPSVKHFGGQPTDANDNPVPPKPYWQDWNSADFYDPPLNYHDQQTKYKQELREYNEKLETHSKSHHD